MIRRLTLEEATMDTRVYFVQPKVRGNALVGATNVFGAVSKIGPKTVTITLESGKRRRFAGDDIHTLRIVPASQEKT